VIDFDLTRMKGIDEKKVKVRVGLLRQRGLRAALTSEEGTLKYMLKASAVRNTVAKTAAYAA